MAATTSISGKPTKATTGGEQKREEEPPQFQQYVMLLLLTGGIYGSFLTWAVLQERVSTKTYDGEKFSFFIVLNLVQGLVASVCALIYMYGSGRRMYWVPRPLLAKMVRASLSQSLASPFGYQSLRYLSYPAVTLGKSSKLLPVAAVSIVVYRQRFPLYKYLALLLITVGAAVFMLLQPSKGSSVGPGLAWQGPILLSINLLLDGYTNSTQDSIFREYPLLRSSHMMLFMNALSSVFMAVYLLNPFNPELLDFVSFVSAHPDAFKDVMLFSVVGSVGQVFVFELLQNFGSLCLVTVTVTRKLFTILLSVVYFGHAIAPGQWVAVGCVFSGLGLEAVMKERSRQQQVRDALRKAKAAKRDASANGDDKVPDSFGGRLTQRSVGEPLDNSEETPL